ncbi:MAG: uroporphyrinogen-III synthase, partial [Alphaproteobacteria bacterium]
MTATRALITRPREDAEPLAERLRAIGIAPVIAPLIEIAPRADAIAGFDLTGTMAVLITSANGARMLAKATERRDLRLFAVGDASAAAARDLGFTSVDSAGGDVSALAQLVYAALPSDGGPLVHVAGSDVAGDLAGALERAGFTVRREVLYDQKPVEILPPAAAKALTKGTVEAVLLYSPRTAATFVELVRKARLETGLTEVTAYCLAENVADKAGGLPWKAVRVAADPEQGALLDLIAADFPPPPAGPASEDISPEEDSEDEAPDDEDMVGAEGDREPSGPPVGRSRRRWVPVIVFLAAVVGAAVLAWPWIDREFGPRLRAWLPGAWLPGGVIAEPAPETPDPLAVLERRLAELEAAARGLPVRAALDEAEARSRAAVAAMEAHLSELRDEIAALATRPQSAPGVSAEEATRMAARIQQQQARIENQEKTVASLAARLEKFESEAAAPPRAAAILLAVGQLRAAVDRGTPYVAEAAALEALFAKRPDPALSAALAALAPRAGSGVPTEADLRRRLPGLARLVLAAPADPGDPGWLGKIRLRLATIITVRRTADGLSAGGPGPDAGADELLARAEARLAAADLAGAIAALATRPQSAPGVSAEEATRMAAR